MVVYFGYHQITSMQRYKILWADDEIDLLKPHILFLENKGSIITPVNNGAEAIERCETENYDIVFLDENMPGMSGLETLSRIKMLKPNLPVVMITKSEEEQIMEEAIGGKIADYLIKPLNPSQILLSMKKILENKRLVSEKTNMSFQQEFANLSMMINDDLDYRGWVDLYREIVFWDLEIETAQSHSMAEVLDMQKEQANAKFAKFISENYRVWVNDSEANKPILSHQLLQKKLFPFLKKNENVFLLVIDNLRFDQWKIIEPFLMEYFVVDAEDLYYSILPTTTAYARNSIFSGLMPLEMAERYPQYWVGEDSEEAKNNFEEEWINTHLKRVGLKDKKLSYQKIKHVNEGKSLIESINNIKNNDLNIIVYNFVDMLSHARTDMAMVRELAPDESAYRSITKSWFEHSPLFVALRNIAETGARLVITTDHGTIRVKKPFKILGDRNTNANLRYKTGKNLNFEKGKIMSCSDPADLMLPKINLTSSYVFATEEKFFAYPNNYNYYVNYYRDTFQHGGISMEEMIIPIISLSSKNAK